MKSRSKRRSRNRTSKRRSKRSIRTRAALPKKPKKLKPLTIVSSPVRNKVYCGDLAYLPSEEYSRFGTRRECLDKGYGVGRASEYNYLRERLQESGYLLPERSYGRANKKDDYEIV